MPQAGVRPGVKAVLFDLDGTLIDSAPDLAGTANDMRLARGLPALPHAVLRPHCGSGARGMLGKGLALQPGDAEYLGLRDEFLGLYQARMLRSTQPFAAMLPVLHRLDEHGLRWGIVTNKALCMAQPLAQALGLLPRAAVLIAGDSTPHTKPHPEPLLEAARRLRLAPSDCIYVGDDIRDMRAGQAATMQVLAAAWGYLGDGEGPLHWQADAVLQEPADLLDWLQLSRATPSQ
ncbi:MAG TPA: HAD-IA family hydrolase [Rubrivivax sp.]|nr:HAD-IA family hydrolase [Rubrivivax sp.]